MSEEETPERHLLFGLLALQNGLISQQQLVAAFSHWVRDKSVPLDQHLIDNGALDEAAGQVLGQLIEAQLQQQGGDVQKNLRLLSGSDVREAKTALAHIEDEDLHKTVVGLAEQAPPAREPSTGPHTGGRFRILHALPGATGGMGEISIAEDEELGRRVAIKQIIRGMADNPNYRQKFQVEAEVTGNLEHPGIVPIYGLGTAADGRPYYAMRLVEGDNLAALIKQFHGGARSRRSDYSGVEFHALVDRVIDVAQAIRYAHSRGVLHRDLKPGNILVGNYGETFVIDWGLARLPQTQDPEIAEPVGHGHADPPRRLNIRSGSQVDATRVGQILGTVGYAPPEQLNGRVDLITERSDVYALGAILYQVLVGRPPVTGGDSDLGELIEQTVAGQITPPRQLNRRAPKSLSAICMKALARDPADRYASAQEFVRELERWKADQPVSAVADSFADRIMRVARRHRAAALAAAVALVGIAVVVGASLLLVNRARLSEAAARQQADHLAKEKTQLAEEKTQLAERNEAVVKSFVAAFRSPDPENQGVTYEMTALDVLEQALVQLDADAGPSRDALTQATLLDAIGTSLVSLGAFDQAIAAHERALKLRQAQGGDVDDETLITMNELATGYHAAGRSQEAIALLEEVLRQRRDQLGDDHPDTLRSMTNLASGYSAAGRLSDALPLYEESLRRTRAVRGDDHADTLQCMNNLATGYYGAGRTDEAIALLEETRRIVEAKLGENHPHTLITINNLAYGYNAAERFEEAMPLLEEVMRRQQAKLGENHPDTLQSMNNLAFSYGEAGRQAESLEMYTENLRLTRLQLGDEHPSTLISMNNLASAYFKAGRFDEALPLLSETLRLKIDTLGTDHPSTLRSMSNLASGYYSAGRVAEALPLYEQALSLRTEKLGRDHPDTLHTRERFAAALIRHREYARAQPVVAEWMSLLGEQQTASRARGATLMAICALAEGDTDAAVNAAEAAVAFEGGPEQERWRAESVLAAARVAQGDAAAESRLIEAFQQLRRRLADLPRHQRWWVQRACQRIVEIHEASNRDDQVRKWRTELTDVVSEIDRLDGVRAPDSREPPSTQDQ